jgi:hypothetical protein
MPWRGKNLMSLARMRSRHIYPETGDGDRRIAYDAEDLIKARSSLMVRAVNPCRLSY